MNCNYFSIVRLFLFTLVIITGSGCRNSAVEVNNGSNHSQRYMQAVDSTRAVHGDSIGTFDLSATNMHLSLDGKVWVTQLNATTRGYLFVKSRNDVCNFSGILCLSEHDPSLIVEEPLFGPCIVLQVPMPITVPLGNNDVLETDLHVDATIRRTDNPRVLEVTHYIE